MSLSYQTFRHKYALAVAAPILFVLPLTAWSKAQTERSGV
jgi:hypothetical protein